MAPQLRDLLFETDFAKASRETSPQTWARISLAPHGVPKDFANLFLGAAAVTASALLKLFLHVIVKLPNK